MRTIITLIFTSFFLTLALSQNTDLALRLEEGKEYTQISASTMTILQDFNEMQVEIVVSTNSTMTFRVKQINEEGYDIYRPPAMIQSLSQME